VASKSLSESSLIDVSADRPSLDLVDRSGMRLEGDDSATIEKAKKLPRPPQLEALTGLRFFAAFFILISHAAAWTSPFIGSDTLSHYGGVSSLYGMTLFFVLSGFVIHYNYGKLFQEMRFRWAATEFIGARFARLYPLFLAFFLVGLVVDGTANWFKEDTYSWIEMVIRFLTLTQSWFYSIVFGDRMVMSNAFGLAWSISTEIFFYFCYLFGLAFIVMSLRTSKQTLIAAAALSAITIILFITANDFKDEIGQIAASHLSGYITPEQNDQESFIRWLFYYSPYARVPEFVLGCLMGQLYLISKDRPVTAFERRIAKIALWLSFVVLALMGAFHATSISNTARDYFEFLALNFLTAVPIATVIFCVARIPCAVSRMLAAAPLVALGETSYSIYAVHTWTLRIFIRQPVEYTTAWGVDAVFRIGFGILLTLVLSSATYRIIEVPSRLWLRSVTSVLLKRLYGEKKKNKAPTSAPRLPQLATAAAFLTLLFGACFIYQFTIGL
jgi:peptidoglycan/LPS O-acetylase OafA/YrhL